MSVSFDPKDLPPPGADVVLAGTLCLMSCYVQHPAALYAERIARNLALLAGAGDVTPELRTICRRLADRWDGIGQEALRRRAAGEAPKDGRVLH
jgi:hypothetical protein